MNKIFRDNGFEAYLVGGAVRDILLGKKASDWDVASNAKPEDVIRIFNKVIPTGIEHGTVTVHFMQNEIEVTTYRIDENYNDGRHPDSVTYTSDITKDIVFRFSKKLGIVDADDMGGSPVYISVEDLHTLPQTDTEAAKKKKFSEKGVYYNIPSKAVVRLTDSSASTIASKECEIAQFGKTELLSDALFNKKNTTKVSFFQTTGGIKSIEGE